MCCNNNWFGAAARSASSCGCGMTASIGYVPVRVYTGSTANNGSARTGGCDCANAARTNDGCGCNCGCGCGCGCCR